MIRRTEVVISRYIDTAAGQLLRIADQSTVDLFNLISESVFLKIYTVSAKSRSIDYLTSCLNIGTLQILDNIFVIDNQFPYRYHVAYHLPSGWSLWHHPESVYSQSVFEILL